MGNFFPLRDTLLFSMTSFRDASLGCWKLAKPAGWVDGGRGEENGVERRPCNKCPRDEHKL